MKLIAVLTFLMPVYIYAQSAPPQAQAQPPEPTPSVKPELPDTTLVGTKKQTKDAKKKADKKMKEEEKKLKEPPSSY